MQTPGQIQEEDSEKALGGFGAKPGQAGEYSGEGLTDFGAEPRQIQPGSGEGSAKSL